MARLGTGAYAGATIDSVRATTARTILVMPLDHCQWVADALSGQPGYTLVLRGDEGNDNDQFDEARSPESEARRFYDRFLAPKLARWRFHAALGPCETWRREPGQGVPQPHLEWRAAFELSLCRLVQNERQLPYGWGSIPIGNLEPEDLRLFAPVLAEAAFTSAHLYLGPGRRAVAEEVDSWYVWRPTRLWLPECQRRGYRFPPLLATEIGTYHPPAQTGLTMPQYAQVCVDIVHALEAEFAVVGETFLGGIPFGYGTVGTMDVWRMDGTEGIIAAANPDYVAIPVPGTQPQPEAQMTEAELQRYAADVWRRYQITLNPASALYKRWYEALRSGRFLGYPMEAEHRSENGRYVIQGFSNTILAWDSQTGQVAEGLPLP